MENVSRVQAGIPDHKRQFFGQVGCIAAFKQQTADAVGDQLRRATYAGAHRTATARHRFQQRVGEGLGFALDVFAAAFRVFHFPLPLQKSS
jgi:hypothetical protein